MNITRRTLLSLIAILTITNPSKGRSKPPEKKKVYRWRKLEPTEIVQIGDKYGNFNPNVDGKRALEELQNFLDPSLPVGPKNFLTRSSWDMFDPHPENINQLATSGGTYAYWRKEQVV